MLDIVADRVRITFETDKADANRLKNEATKLGIGSSSALLRLIVKQFFKRIDKGGDAFNSN